MVVQCIGLRCTVCQNSCQFTIVQPQRNLCVIKSDMAWQYVLSIKMNSYIYYIFIYQHACDQYVILHQFSNIRTMSFIMKLYKC